MFEPPPARPVPLCWFPDYRDTNPYQTLLYEGLGPTLAPEPAPLAEALDRQAKVAGGRMIFICTGNMRWWPQARSSGSSTISSGSGAAADGWSGRSTISNRAIPGWPGPSRTCAAGFCGWQT